MAKVPVTTMITSLIQLIQLASDPKSMDNLILETSSLNSSTLDCDTVQFYLVTRSTLNGSALKACTNQTTTIFNGTFESSKPTKILVHGWRNSRHTEFTTNLTRSYLNASDINIIQVDWSAIAMENYILARMKVPAVGIAVAAFITRITHQLKVEFSDLHLIGHSLGAHVVGIAGYQFQSPNKIKTVTGLDPAGPLFWATGSDGMITKESGEFVVILHTCAGLLGTSLELGHADFYANGGIPLQPGCADLLGFCSHDRAIDLYSESLLDPVVYDSTKCSSDLFYILGFCRDNDHAYFGGDVNRNASGKYYFKTSSTYPFK